MAEKLILEVDMKGGPIEGDIIIYQKGKWQVVKIDTVNSGLVLQDGLLAKKIEEQNQKIEMLKANVIALARIVKGV